MAIGRAAVGGVVRIWLIIQKLIKKILVQARGVEGIAAPPMRQCKPGRGADIRLGDLAAAVPCGMQPRPARSRCPPACRRPRTLHTLAMVASCRSPRRTDGSSVRALTILMRSACSSAAYAATKDVGRGRMPSARRTTSARSRIPRRGDLDCQPEAVQQLWSELTFLGVHRSDQDQPGGVCNRDAVPLDSRATHRRRIQQQVDQMIMKQVHFVHIENPAASRGQQPGFVHHLADAQGLPQIERADHPIFSSTHWELDQLRWPRVRHGMIMGTVWARRIGVLGVATEAAVLDHGDAGQHLCESTTMVVLAVPFSPRTRTPPTSGETVVKIKASAMSSEPTTAENGNVRTSHPSCGYPRPRHAWVGPAYAGRDDDRRGRRPDFPDLADDERPGHSGGTAPDLHRIPLPSPPR